MRTAKGTRKINDWEKAPGKTITCPECGKILQKSSQTNSVIYCPRCGYPSFTYLEDTIRIQCPARLLEAESAGDYIKTAITALQKLRSAPIRDYEYVLEDDFV